MLEWRPRTNTGGRGRPPKRWIDDIRGRVGVNWMAMVRDREKWKLGDLGCDVFFVAKHQINN